MIQTFRQQAFVKSQGRIEIQDDRLTEGKTVEVIIVLEEPSKPLSAEALAIARLPLLKDSSKWITVMEPGQEIDEMALKEWIADEQD
ncbi:MAG: hypothetical protein ACRC6M_03045 [Microcystaceae cyanobacterium]